MKNPSNLKTLQLNVTQKQIDEAMKRDSKHCIVADAVKAKWPQAQYVHADISTIRFTVGERRYWFVTPPKAQLAIQQFDAGLKVKPFTLVSTLRVQYAPQGIRPNFIRKKAVKKKAKQKRIYPSRNRVFGACLMVPNQ